MTVYIAWPITGDAGYRLKFAAAAEAIRRNSPDAVVINPALLPEGMGRADYMAICLPMLMRADVVYLLPGWRRSGGAQIEMRLADYLRIRTVEISPEQLRGSYGGPGVKSHFLYKTSEYLSECSCDRDSCEGCKTYEAHKSDAHDEEDESEQK